MEGVGEARRRRGLGCCFTGAQVAHQEEKTPAEDDDVHQAGAPEPVAATEEERADQTAHDQAAEHASPAAPHGRGSAQRILLAQTGL